MRLESKYQIRVVAGENILMKPVNTTGVEMQVIDFNATAKKLWDELVDKDFDEGDVVRLLMENYEVDDVTAQRDAHAWLEVLRQNGLLVDEQGMVCS